MAEEKDTDSAPDEGLTESGSANPENGVRDEYDELDALDEREDEFDDVDDVDDDSGPDADDSDDRELVGVGAGSRSRSAADGSSGAVAKSAASGRKGRATPKQRAGEDKPTRTGPIGFIRGSITELQRVVYPTWPQLLNYFVVVLVFVLVVIAIVSGLDYGFGWLTLKVFGA